MKVFCVSLSFVIVLFLQVSVVAPNPDARRLYEDLLTNYNKLIRPVANNSDKLMVKLGLRLSQLIDVVSVFASLIYKKVFLKWAFWISEPEKSNHDNKRLAGPGNALHSEPNDHYL